MSWSYVGTINRTLTASPSAINAWPSGIQANDVVVMVAMISQPAATGSDRPTTSTTGWFSSNNYEEVVFWTRYSALQSLPTLTFNATYQCRVYLFAFRSTVNSAFGGTTFYGNNTGFTQTTIVPETLLVIVGGAHGDQSGTGGISWSFSPSGWTTLINVSGAYTGDPYAYNFGIAWRSVATPTTLTGVSAYLSANTQYIFVAAESPGQFLFADN